MDIEFIKKNASAFGTCRENFHWYFCEGTLLIEGSGELDYIEDFSYFYDPSPMDFGRRKKPVIHPWKDRIPDVKHVAIGEGCTKLGLGCFEWHQSLESIQLPESLLCIGMDAFCGCIRLRSVVIPGQVREIEEGAFAGCLNLASVQLPEEIKIIGKYAFQHCLELKELAVPGGVESVGTGAFPRKLGDTK